jgi:hypothetical protein
MAIHIIEVLHILDDKANVAGDPRTILKRSANRLNNARIPLTLVDLTIRSENQTDPVGLLVPCSNKRIVIFGPALRRRIRFDRLTNPPGDRP